MSGREGETGGDRYLLQHSYPLNLPAYDGDHPRVELPVGADVHGVEARVDPALVAEDGELAARKSVLDPGGADVGEVCDHRKGGVIVVQMGRGEGRCCDCGPSFRGGDDAEGLGQQGTGVGPVRGVRDDVLDGAAAELDQDRADGTPGP